MLLTSLVYSPLCGAAESVDPDNDGSQYAWSANLGWINAEPQGDGGPGLELSAGQLSGWLWSANTGWISLSCENTASCDAVAYGISRDGNNNLSGYAWSPNLGWISFSCTDSNSCGNIDYGVQIATPGGEMSGHAWAANAGWVSFSCTNSASCGTVDFDVKLSVTPPPELIFEDGFESPDEL
jgi:uncharacterized membrane protein